GTEKSFLNLGERESRSTFWLAGWLFRFYRQCHASRCSPKIHCQTTAAPSQAELQGRAKAVAQKKWCKIRSKIPGVNRPACNKHFWHPSGVLMVFQRFPGGIARAQPPANFWQPFRLRNLN